MAKWLVTFVIGPQATIYTVAGTPAVLRRGEERRNSFGKLIGRQNGSRVGSILKAAAKTTQQGAARATLRIASAATCSARNRPSISPMNSSSSEVKKCLLREVAAVARRI